MNRIRGRHKTITSRTLLAGFRVITNCGHNRRNLQNLRIFARSPRRVHARKVVEISGTLPVIRKPYETDLLTGPKDELTIGQVLDAPAGIVAPCKTDSSNWHEPNRLKGAATNQRTQHTKTLTETRIYSNYHRAVDEYPKQLSAHGADRTRCQPG